MEKSLRAQSEKERYELVFSRRAGVGVGGVRFRRTRTLLMDVMLVPSRDMRWLMNEWMDLREAGISMAALCYTP